MKIILFSGSFLDSSPLISQCLFYMRHLQVRYFLSDTTHLISKLVNEVQESLHPLNFILLVSIHYPTHRCKEAFILSSNISVTFMHLINIPYLSFPSHAYTSWKASNHICTLVIQLTSPPGYNLVQWFPSQDDPQNQLELVVITSSDPGPPQSELVRMRFRNVHADITALEIPVISWVYLPLIWYTFS